MNREEALQHAEAAARQADQIGHGFDRGPERIEAMVRLGQLWLAIAKEYPEPPREDTP